MDEQPTRTNCARVFATGATRDTEEGKLDFEGFLSPAVLCAFGRYMHENRKQSDGKLRESDNWQKGMDQSVYMKSLLRHTVDLWSLHRGEPAREGVEQALGGILFNAMGYWFELLRANKGGAH